MGVIVAALVGTLLLAVPGAPLYKKPVLGLDLQGGLEVVLQAVPPKGHTLTQPTSTRRSWSSRSGSTNPAGPRREIGSKAKTQFVFRLPAVQEPATWRP